MKGSIWIDGVSYTATQLYNTICIIIRELRIHASANDPVWFYRNRVKDLRDCLSRIEYYPNMFPDWCVNQQLKEYLTNQDSDTFMIGYELIKDKIDTNE